MTVRSLVAVQGFCQYSGYRRLAGTLGTSKQVRMGGPASIDRPFQDTYDRLLTNDAVERGRTVLSVK